jgi:hypothetical protein
MATIKINFLQSKGSLASAGKTALRIFGILLAVYLAFFCYIAVHEWAGHILVDAFGFARHGTYLATFEVVVQFLRVRMEAGRLTVGLVPFRIGGEVISAIPHDIFTFSDWEDGFARLWGSGITTLFSLVFLIVLNLRWDIRRFPWFASAFTMSSMIFDQILYTFGNSPDALIGAIQMGINPIFFKGLVICLVLLQARLLVRFLLRYRRTRLATADPV